MGCRKYYAWHSYTDAGITEDWNSCQREMRGKPGAKAQGFSSYCDAWRYAYPSSESDELFKEDEKLKPCRLEHGDYSIPPDMPQIINDDIYEILETESLKYLDIEIITEAQSLGALYEKGDKVSYFGKVRAYLLLYMPVNFYKVWIPLYRLCYMQRLKKNCSILEYGCGPGTATLGTIAFFIEFAKCNPGSTFELLITSVEREPGFESIYNRLTTDMLDMAPYNLRINIEFLLQDAFDDKQEIGHRYDIVMESNMLNISEGGNNIEVYVDLLDKYMQPEGCAVFIEPGKTKEREHLETIFACAQDRENYVILSEPNICEINVSEIRLYKESKECGLRYKDSNTHWYSYGIIMKKGAV